MKKKLFILVLFVLSNCFSQSQIKLTLHNIPKNKNSFGNNIDLLIGRYINGEFQQVDKKTIPNDTIAVFNFNIPVENPTGLYTVFIGDVTEKEVNKAEFIWNPKESFNLEAQYYQLKNGELIIEKSIENQAYVNYLLLKREFEGVLEKMLKQRISISLFNSNSKQQAIEIEHQTENIQFNYNNRMAELGLAYPNTFVSNTLIPLTLIPVRSVKDEWVKNYDSYLSFLNENYFYHCNSQDSSNLYHYALQDKIFYYLSSFCDKNDVGTKKGIDVIMNSFKNNNEVFNQIYNLLLKTFIKLESESLTNYILEKYSNDCFLNLPFEELKKLQNIQSLAKGGLVPEISLQDKDAKYNSLREYCSKNKITILVIWISWCSKCQSEIPKLNHLYSKFKSSGLGIYSVSLDEKKEDWLKVSSLNKNWKNVCELVPLNKSSVLSNYNISSTPTLFILDSNAKIIGKNIYGEPLENFILESLK